MNGEEATGTLEQGYLTINRQWQANDVVDVDFSMPVRLVHGNEKIAATRGQVAFERGPIVYCVEGHPAGTAGHRAGPAHQRGAREQAGGLSWRGHVTGQSRQSACLYRDPLLRVEQSGPCADDGLGQRRGCAGHDRQEAMNGVVSGVRTGRASSVNDTLVPSEGG